MMKNEKIGVGIVHCQSGQNTMTSGFGIAFKSDDCDWSKMIDDTGEVFKYIKINGNSLIIRMIHFTKDGWYMCSMKPSLSRDGEYRASWVYFPICISLKQNEINEIIKTAESQIERSNYDETKLKDVISKYSNHSNSVEECPSFNIPFQQSGFAFRDVSNSNGYRNLFDLYDCIYQKDFVKYKWVVLMEKSDAISLKIGITDISNNKIYSSIVIKPESVNDTFGFTPYLKGNKFEKAIRIQEGDTLSIVYKKNGYQDISKSVRGQSDLKISIEDCYKKIEKSWFLVQNVKNDVPIQNSVIELYGGEDKGNYWIFPEKNLGKAKISVKSEGYFTKELPVDLSNVDSNKKYTVKLVPESHEYHFIIPFNRCVVKDSPSTEITINSQFEITESPLDGYICHSKPKEGGYKNSLYLKDSRNNQSPIGQTNSNSGGSYIPGGEQIMDQNQIHNVGSPEVDICKRSKNISHWKLIVFVIGVIILISALFIGGMKLWQGINNHNNRYEVVSNNPAPEDQQQLDYGSWNAALEYLQKHTDIISKEEMEKYDKLKCLYDILNEYRFREYISFIDACEIKTEIMKIQVWKEIYNKSINYSQNKKNGRYIKDGAEQTITLSNYVKKVFSQQSESEGGQESKIKDSTTTTSEGSAVSSQPSSQQCPTSSGNNKQNGGKSSQDNNK